MSKTKAAVTAQAPASDNIQVYYARFHQPVPPYLNREPVSEFKSGIANTGSKYYVERMQLNDRGLWFTANGEVNLVPMANIIYIRTIA